MKKAETMQALDAMDEVRTSGDLRRIVSNTLLALSRKEISATDVEVIAKGLDTISNSLNVEIKMARLDIDLKTAGLKMKSDAELGKLHIG
jgi:hypothetical protein